MSKSKIQQEHVHVAPVRFLLIATLLACLPAASSAQDAPDPDGPLDGRALAQLLREHRAEAEWSEALEQVVSLTADLVDRSIYAAASEIAADPGAGTAARVQAIRVLYYQITPGSRDPYESFLPATRTFHVPGLHGPAVGDPLPGDVLGQLAALAAAIIDDPATNEPVRSAATKLRIAAEVDAARARSRQRPDRQRADPRFELDLEP